MSTGGTDLTPAFSHVALSVGRGDGPLAARLLEHLAFAVTDNGPSGRGEPWYTARFDVQAGPGGLAHLGCFVVPVSDEQLALDAAIARSCAAELAAVSTERRGKPDSNPHVALSYPTIDALEDAVLAVRADPDVAARASDQPLRPERAPDELEVRLDRSPVFGDAERVRHLTSDVQVFVTTDLVGSGPLGLGQALELNHSAGPAVTTPA